MKAIILDTETHTLNGLPIEIAYVPCEVKDGSTQVFADQAFDEYFSVGEPISYGAMAVHHILESDIADKPAHTTFKLPESAQYIIGHNIDYDVEVIKRSGVDTSHLKAICTLALARKVWPEAESHNISALTYMIFEGIQSARDQLRSAHNAKQDVLLTGNILKSIVNKLQATDLEHLYQLSEEARIPSIITFGKHKGTSVKDLPSDYKAWLLKQNELDPYLRKALTA